MGMDSKNLLESFERSFTDENKSLSVIKSLASTYHCIYYVDIKNQVFKDLSVNCLQEIKDTIGESGYARENFIASSKVLVKSEFEEEYLEFTDLLTLADRLKDKESISLTFEGPHVGWCEGLFIVSDRDDKGKVTHVLWVVRSVTEEHKRELQLKQSLKELKESDDILSSAGYGTWTIIFEEGRKHRMSGSRKMMEIMGLENVALSEEEVYQFWYDRIDKRDLVLVLMCSQKISDGISSEVVYRWNHPEKGSMYIRCGGSLYPEEKKGQKILRGFQGDVTQYVLHEDNIKAELEYALREAKKANAAKSNFLFNMSHDIRTPMNAIMGFTDLLETHIEDKDKCIDYLHKIKQSNTFLLSLINNVLEMARIESGAATLDISLADHKAFNESIISVFENAMKEKNIKLVQVKGNMNHEKILYDETKLRQIFLNIMSNAVKYTPVGGTITMRFDEVPSLKPGYCACRTIIEDTGIGMSKEFIPHIFDDFTRERSTTDSKIMGTGLGMAIVKKLVDLMDGTIQVESELGEGSKFTVILHHKIADEIENEHKQNVKEDISVKNLRGKRILLAEDNELNAEIAGTILSEAGFIVEYAEDGIVCVDKVEKHVADYYDVILMDIQMPNMDGYKATRVIRHMPNGRKAGIPIIAMTANAFEEDKANAFAAGMNGHVAKPVDIRALLETLSCILE